MKKVTISHDVYIMGYGTVKEGTVLNVIHDNSLYVYADLSGCEVRLSKKHDCKPQERRRNNRRENP